MYKFHCYTKRAIAIIGGFCLSASSLLSQEAQLKAEQDLALAKRELQSLQDAVLDEETVLVREVEKLDDEVVTLSRELKKLLREEDGLFGKQKKIDDEIAGRKGEFEYTLSSLRSYANGLKNRLHGAEKQLIAEQLDEIHRNATSMADNVPAETEERLKALKLGAERLMNLSGGHRFSGKAVSSGSDIVEGEFVVLGPLGYYSSNDGSISGFTGSAGSAYPSLKIPPSESAPGMIKNFVSSGSGVVPVDATLGKALQVEGAKKGVSDYLKGGGVVGYGILIMGLLALVVALYKLYQIQTFPVASRKKINSILDSLLNGETATATDKADNLKGLSGDMVRSGVDYFFAKRRILEDALMEKLSMIQPKLDRFLPFLALVAAAAPMMGLLGTVLGIMKTFALMSAVGTGGDSKAFSAGISEALITTAMGLIVAIPVIIIHGMLKSQAKGKFGQVEGVALSMINGTTEITETPEQAGDEKDDPDEDIDEQELTPQPA